MRYEQDQIDYLKGDNLVEGNYRKQSVEDFATYVAKELSYNSPDDLENVVNNLGGRIHFHHLDEWLGEKCSIFIHGECNFDIVLPVHTSPRRDSFTICHELGHYFLHSEQGKQPLIAHRSGSSRIEWEANWFAASFLMPKDRFRELCLSHPLESVAVRLGVSLDAAKVRAKSLDIS